MARGIAEDLTNQKINHWTILEELGGGYVKAQCECGTIKELRKAQIKNGHSKSCGCLSGKQKRDIVGQKINHWTIIEDIGGGKVLCQCDCAAGTMKELYKKAVYEGKSKSCGCASGRQRRDIVGQKINHWTVLEDLGGGKVKCQCDCENKTIRELYKKAVYEGKSKSCGCTKTELCKQTKDASGYVPSSKYIGESIKGWNVVDKVKGENKLVCEDENGNRKIFYTSHVARGGIATPDYRTKNNLAGQKINHWTVLEDLPNQKVKVQCDCPNKTVRIIYRSTLVRNMSKSCGCVSAKLAQETMMKRYGDICTLKLDKPREDWQIETLNDSTKFKEYITSFEEKPDIPQLIEGLSVNKASILRTIHKFKCEQYIKFMRAESYMENELLKYIESITNQKIVRHYRGLKDSQYELDIYLPESNLAIEFNGTYWHSSIYKDKFYHQLKTLMCMDEGIRLIHIFEYEWDKNKKNIKQFLLGVIGSNKEKIYARECKVQNIDNARAKEFEDSNHLQGSLNSSINIGLIHNNKLVGLMTFGKPRFDDKCKYELLRLCYDTNYSIIGGSERMFKHFLGLVGHTDKCSIVSYCDVTKFTGSVYERLGFKLETITPPNYIWCDNHNQILTRYQTQKHKLLELGVGEDTQSESEIMEDLGYLKIYNSGNAKYIYNKN